MTPYITQHAAPMAQVMAGIVSDIPRYVRENSSSDMIRYKGYGRGKTPAARAMQAKMLVMIKSGDRMTTMDMVKQLDSNRFTVYQNAAQMVEDGLIKLVKIGAKRFYWEAI